MDIEQKMRIFLKDHLPHDSYETVARASESGESPYSIKFYDSGADRVELGCTSIVLFFKEFSDYVFKIPCVGIYYNGDRDYARLQKDYCLLSKTIYDESCSLGISDILCEIKYLGTINDFPVWYQERVQSEFAYDEYAGTHSDDSRKYAYENCYRCGMVESHIEIFYNYYGGEKMDTLFSLLAKYDVIDCHCGNLGYIDDRPVIFDYAGYND